MKIAKNQEEFRNFLDFYEILCQAPENTQKKRHASPPLPAKSGKNLTAGKFPYIIKADFQ